MTYNPYDAYRYAKHINKAIDEKKITIEEVIKLIQKVTKPIAKK